MQIGNFPCVWCTLSSLQKSFSALSKQLNITVWNWKNCPLKISPNIGLLCRFYYYYYYFGSEGQAGSMKKWSPIQSFPWFCFIPLWFSKTQGTHLSLYKGRQSHHTWQEPMLTTCLPVPSFVSSILLSPEYSQSICCLLLQSLHISYLHPYKTHWFPWP